MLIPVGLMSKRLGLHPSGVVHIGAHAAEELEAYRRYGWSPRIWVEALPDLAAELSARLEESEEDRVIEGAAWSSAGLTLTLNRASNNQSSSLLEPADHLVAHPSVTFEDTVEVTTVTLDVMLATRRLGERFDFLNLDIQGAELESLRGLSDWAEIGWVYTEVSARELYAGQPVIGDLDAFLGARGFRRVATVLLSRYGWGDALYAERRAWRNIPVRRRAAFVASVLLHRARVRASLVKADVRARLGAGR